MRLPRWLKRTKPDFSVNEFFVWVFFVVLGVALIPNLFGLSVGVASGFIAVIAGKKAINSTPWGKRLLRRDA